ncbi:hypothetical protein LTS15_004706 [Exophiala xenobiotica]|nr:hypothetical protein LTS15_004706 [Exophiala xenobiotica]
MATSEKRPRTPSSIRFQSTSHAPESFARSPMITVYVGEEKTSFYVHEEVLRSQSPFFDKCLSSGMKEQHTKTIELPEDDPQAFEHVVAFMYGGVLDVQTKVLTDWKFAVLTYILADKLCMLRMQNIIADHLQWSEYLGMSLDTETVMWVWEHTDDACKLRDLVLDRLFYDVMFTLRHKRQDDTAKAIGTAFEEISWAGGCLSQAVMQRWIDVADKLDRLEGRDKWLPPNPTRHIGCKYHVQDQGRKCTCI